MREKLNKYPIKLIGIFILLLSIMSTIHIQSRNSSKLMNEVGDRSELDDISIVCSEPYKVFDDTEVIINKDGLNTITKNTKVIDRDYVDIDINHRYMTSTAEEYIYSNDKYIGNVGYYAWDDEVTIEINNKDKKNNKKEFIEIKFEGDDLYNYAYLEKVFIKDEDIYMILYSDNYENNEVYKVIGKVNLNERKFEYLNKSSLKGELGDETDFLSDVIFINDNNIYLRMKGYFNMEDASDEYYYYLIYDINSNDFEYTDEEAINKESVVDYYVDDNKLNTINRTSDKDNILIHNIYELSDLEKVESKTYDIGITFYDNTYHNDILSLEVVDDKIYIITNNKRTLSVTKDNKYTLDSNHPINIKVVDMKSGKVSYESKLVTKEYYPYLVKEYTKQLSENIEN